MYESIVQQLSQVTEMFLWKVTGLENGRERWSSLTPTQVSRQGFSYELKGKSAGLVPWWPGQGLA